MAATFLDPIRDAIDKLDNEIDKVAVLPFVGSLVAPYAKVFDEIRKIVDELDPPAAKPATK